MSNSGVKGGQSRGSQGDGTGGGRTEDRGGSQPKYSPDDDRAIVKNPTSQAHEDDKINRDKQKR